MYLLLGVHILSAYIDSGTLVRWLSEDIERQWPYIYIMPRAYLDRGRATEKRVQNQGFEKLWL